jgi:hypothetical protein
MKLSVSLRFFFLNHRQSVGLLGRVISSSQGDGSVLYPTFDYLRVFIWSLMITKIVVETCSYIDKQKKIVCQSSVVLTVIILINGILETRKRNVSETGSVSVLRWGGGKTPTQLGPLERANLLSLGQCLPHHLRTETDPVTETLCFVVSRILDDGKSPKTQQFWVLYTIVRSLQKRVCVKN